jgi:protein PhnA
MALRPEDLSEEEMLAAEARFPELAAKAGRKAYAQALAETGSVVVASGDRLVTRYADGSERLIQMLPPDLRVKRGAVLKRANLEAGTS